MNKKELLISIVVCAVLVVVYFITAPSNQTVKIDKTILGDIDVSTVDKLSIKDSKGRITEIDKIDGKWCLSNKNAFPVDFDKLSRFIESLVKIKPVTFLEIEKEQFPVLGLGDKNEGKQLTVNVTLKDAKGTVLKSIVLGKMHVPKDTKGGMFGPPLADGRYIYVEGEQFPVLIKKTFSTITGDVMGWLSSEWFKIDDIKSIEHENPAAKSSWKIVKDGNEFKFNRKLNDEEKLSKNNISAITDNLKNMTFDDICTKDVISAEKPISIMKVGTKNFNYELTLFKKEKKNYLEVKVAKTADANSKVLQTQSENEQALSKFIFIIPDYRAKVLQYSEKQLVMKKKKK